MVYSLSVASAPDGRSQVLLSRPLIQMLKNCRGQFFLFVSTFLFHFTNIYYVISLRLEVYQYTDCTFLCIYKAQHYRTLQTHLIQTFLYVAPFVHKCPQKYYKHEINPMSSCMTELVEPH